MSKVTLRSVVLALLVAAVLAGCGSDAEVPAEAPSLGITLRDIGTDIESGSSEKLTEFTDFAWDTVHLFGQGTRRSAVNEQLGLEVFVDRIDERLGLLSDDYVAVFLHENELAYVGEIPAHFQLDGALEFDASTATIAKDTATTGVDVFTLRG